jgi:hypothetical protein
MNALAEFKLPAVPNQKEATKLAVPLIDNARELKITDEDGYLASWALIERHDAAIKKIREMFDPFVDALHKLHKMAVGLRSQFLDPVLASKNALLGKRGIYRQEQERIAQKKRDADAEILRKAQQKDLQKEAKQLEKVGNVEAAAVVREQAAALPAPVMPVVPAVQKQAGSVEKEVWKFAVDDYALVPDAFRLLDPTKKTERELIDSKINAVVSKLGDKMPIAGVRIWPVKVEHSRAVR